MVRRVNMVLAWWRNCRRESDLVEVRRRWQLCKRGDLIGNVEFVACMVRFAQVTYRDLGATEEELRHYLQRSRTQKTQRFLTSEAETHNRDDLLVLVQHKEVTEEIIQA
jgi:hypothetical protein